MERYAIRVAGDDLSFAAAHFITFDDGSVEPLHGHTYLAAVEIELPLGPSSYTIDFTAVRRLRGETIRPLDHRLLLPGNHPALAIERRGDEIEVRWGPRRWVVPADDCRVLPLANTPAESLARHIAESLRSRLAAEAACRPARLRVELDEACVCRAIWESAPPSA